VTPSEPVMGHEEQVVGLLTEMADRFLGGQA
jgi:hypothetical protein